MDAASHLAGHPSGLAPDAQPDDQPALSDRDREILEFERQWWKYAGAKETAVREQFDMSATRYYQVLNALIDRPEAMEVDLLVRRRRRSGTRACIRATARHPRARGRQHLP